MKRNVWVTKALARPHIFSGPPLGDLDVEGFFISWTAFPRVDKAVKEEREVHMLAGVDEVIAQLAAGLGIPGEEIEAWVES